MGLAQQFGRPSGLLGLVVGRGMARGNASLSRWVVAEAARVHDGPVARVAELGPGPGVGLEALLSTFDGARVWGVDRSALMVKQSGQRNREAVASGRLTVLEGDVSALAALRPLDVVMANHVLYFWSDPAAELASVREALGERGLLALGYQLRKDMPALAQRRFPPAGHRLYDYPDEVTALAVEAGFSSVSQVVKGPPDAPEGRVALAVV